MTIWFPPSIEPLPDALVTVFDPTNEPTVWPAKWNAKTETFDSNGGWFEKDEVVCWCYTQTPPTKAELELVATLATQVETTGL